ncbi:MAG TPA: M20/M25/M40 family metallo-hydrolase [Pirellulaceae bacterium]|nr:M20/M25/M40 family metallo-hydrolase [Pirellulaceae bacterium]HMO92427.1 M20/M25/M40 family metallo-hydrolase [Pirellulaceae bacterium]HMP69546.1 M20/M25/M40 family metallo-hydrolase [Pirellulaceae bacterium]
MKIPRRYHFGRSQNPARCIAQNWADSLVPPLMLVLALLVVLLVTSPLSLGNEFDDIDATKRAALMTEFGVTSEQLDDLLRIIDEGKNRNQAMDHLSHLCEKIGPRLTGSSRLERANRWAAEQFESFGLQNVRLHEWGTIPVRFDRGPSTGKMVAPEERIFEFTARAWSAGTDGPKTGPVLREPTSVEELEEIADKLEGAWILRRQGNRDNSLIERMQSAGILGTISGSRDELVTTGGIPGLRQLDFDNLPKDVNIFVRRSDYDAINSRLADGIEVVCEFNLNHKFTKGPIPCYNTIAEIPGTELPEQVIIISGHLDSWDGPGSQGTVDNGTGSVVTIEAARILMAAGIKPKRTIRFILWSGEEQGLLGSRAYVAELSEEERANISAVFVDDSGTNQQSSLSGTRAMEPMLQQIVKPMNYAFPELVAITVSSSNRMPRGGASDHAPFNAVGIPGFFWGKTGRAVYRYAWHTQNDRIDQAVPEYLVKNSTVSAIAAYMLSEAETLLPRDVVEGEDDAEPRPRRRRGDRGEGQGGGDGGSESNQNRNDLQTNS